MLDKIRSVGIRSIADAPTTVGEELGYRLRLCRCRFSSFRCLCLRIFLRRFLITLPNGYPLRNLEKQRGPLLSQLYQGPDGPHR